MDGVQLPQGYSHFEETVYFLPFSSQKFLVKIFLTPGLLPTRTCAYQAVGDVTFSEYFANVINEWSQTKWFIEHVTVSGWSESYQCSHFPVTLLLQFVA